MIPEGNHHLIEITLLLWLPLGFILFFLYTMLSNVKYKRILWPIMLLVDDIAMISLAWFLGFDKGDVIFFSGILLFGIPLSYYLMDYCPVCGRLLKPQLFNKNKFRCPDKHAHL
ncbi:MAG: hypothetical protein R8L53_07005 [Mariprofundales bacterium]